VAATGIGHGHLSAIENLLVLDPAVVNFPRNVGPCCGVEVALDGCGGGCGGGGVGNCEGYDDYGDKLEAFGMNGLEIEN
jgi:hypothetical protein